MPLTTLLRNPSKVKEAAKESIIRITEHGEGAYIFATEESFEGYIRREREDAAFQARLEASIEQGLADIEAGRVDYDVERFFDEMHRKYGKPSSQGGDG